MKKNIHPKYYNDAKTTCACGNVTEAGSTQKELKTELCSACHPFYTGKQKLVDTAGRVDKYKAKVEKAKAYKAKNEKKNKKDTTEETTEQEIEEEETPDENQPQAKLF